MLKYRDETNKLFFLCLIDKTRSNENTLWQGMFRLGTRKTLSTTKALEYISEGSHYWYANKEKHK